LNVAKKPMRARARKGEAQGVLSYQKATGIFDNPHICNRLPMSFLILPDFLLIVWTC